MKKVIFQVEDNGCWVAVESPNGTPITNNDIATVIYTAASLFRLNVRCGCDKCAALKAACDLIADEFGGDQAEPYPEDTIGEVAGCA